MNNKILIFVGGGVAVLIIVVMLAVYFNLPQGGTPNKTITAPGTNAPVQTSDFISTSPTYDQSTIIYADSDYSIDYDAAVTAFYITFTNLEPSALRSNRVIAETKFLEKLQISQEQACQLKVTEVVPPLSREQEKNQTFYLSFCPGGEIFANQ